MKLSIVPMSFRAVVAVAAMAFFTIGCDDDNNGVNNGGTEGRLVLLIHDAPVDDFREVWLTVTSVRMIGADDDSTGPGDVILSQPVRMDFLKLDSTAQILAAVNVGAGSYSKIRLQVTDPEFVRDDDSVFSGDDIHLVANGHVDLNTQGDVLIVGNEVTVVSLDLALENSIQINQTGNGRYILRPQIFVDNTLEDEEGIIIVGATVSSINLGTSIIVVETSGNESDATLSVQTNGATEVLSIDGLPIALSSLSVGSHINVVGTIDVETGLVTATEVQIVQ